MYRILICFISARIRCCEDYSGPTSQSEATIIGSCNGKKWIKVASSHKVSNRTCERKEAYSSSYYYYYYYRLENLSLC